MQGPYHQALAMDSLPLGFLKHLQQKGLGLPYPPLAMEGIASRSLDSCRNAKVEPFGNQVMGKGEELLGSKALGEGQTGTCDPV